MSFLQIFKAAWSQSFCIPKTDYEQRIPDLQGKVMIVTGGNTGIGYQTIKVLLQHHAKVYLAARSPTKGQAAIEQLKRDYPDADLHFLDLDLADVKKAKEAGKSFLAREQRLDVLFNSGGVMNPPNGSKTADGYELQLGTNVLGHFAFTMALLPVLLKTAAELKAQGGFVRVVNTSSSTHMMAPAEGIVFDDINMGNKSPQVKYAHSKFGNIMFSNELARRYKDAGIYSASLNPGNIQTELQRHDPLMARLSAWMLYPVALGAISQLYAGTSPDVTLADTGSFYIPWARKGSVVHVKANDAAVAKKLWDWLDGEAAKY